MSMNTTLLMFPVSRNFNKMMLLFRSFSMSHSRCGKGIVGAAPVTGYVNRVVLEQQRLCNHLRCDRFELVDVHAENALALLAIIIALHHLSKQHPVQLGRHRHNVRHTVRDHVLSQTPRKAWDPPPPRTTSTAHATLSCPTGSSEFTSNRSDSSVPFTRPKHRRTTTPHTHRTTRQSAKKSSDDTRSSLSDAYRDTTVTRMNSATNTYRSARSAWECGHRRSRSCS